MQFRTSTLPLCLLVSFFGFLSDSDSDKLVPVLLDKTPIKYFHRTNANSTSSLAPCSSLDDELGGNVFQDFNNDGADAGATEVGQENVLVEVYGCDGNIVCTALTDEGGNWNCDIDAGDYPVRIEFTTPMQPYLQSSDAGTGNGTNVQFADAPRCNVNYGVIDPVDYCQANPLVGVSCYVAGDPSSAQSPLDAFVSFQYGISGDAVPPTVVLEKSVLGAVWGQAYDRTNEQVLTGALLKRQIGLREGLAVNPLGAIYTHQTDGSGFGLWAEVANPGIIPTNTLRGLAAPFDPAHDVAAFDLSGKVGFGDLEVNDDNSVLYAVNLNTKELLAIAINPDGTAGTQQTYAIPLDLCGNPADARPWALKFRQGKLYVGVTCTAESTGLSSDLSMGIYEFDPATNSFAPNPVFDLPLNYPRGVVYTFPAGCDAEWQAWTSDFSDIFLCGSFFYYPSPLLSDIEFDVDGSVIVGLIDRFGLQQNPNNYRPDVTNNTVISMFGAGDILRVCDDGAGGFEYCAPNLANGQGPGGGEFYFGDEVSVFSNGTGRHQETFSGGLSFFPGSGEVLGTVYDPFDAEELGMDRFNEGGIKYFDNVSGDANRSYLIYPNLTGLSAKGLGLGDPELFCDPVPIQIGNYVWIDEDADGVQDACEMPLDGIPISLYNKDESAFEDVQTTANGGQYYFDDVDPNTNYAIVFGYDHTSTATDGLWDETAGELTVGTTAYELTTADSGGGNNPDLNDSDATLMDMATVTQYPIISYTTSDTTDHTLDVGLSPIVECDLTITAITPVCNYNAATGQSTFDVTITVAWDFADLTTTAEMIDVTFNGATMSTASLNTATGTADVVFTGVAGPAYGQAVTAAFANTASCNATSLVDLIACTPDCVDGAGTVGGNAFNDFDSDGADAGAGEVGQENVLVEVYDCDGVIVCSTYTNAEGNWSCPNLTDGEEYRVEFTTPLQPYLQSSIAGANNGTNTQFVTAPSCAVDYGVIDPNTYCQDDPDVVVTCFIVGDPTSSSGPFDVVVNYPQSREGVDPDDASFVPPNMLSAKGEAGTVWGMAYDRSERDVYVSAFLKRHSGLLETDPVSGAPLNNPLGAIFRTNLDGGATELLIDLSTQGINVGTILSNADRGVNRAPNLPNTDSLAYTLIGKVGLGDIALDEENSILYAVNLFNKTLVSIVINDDGTTGAVSETPIPEPGCSGGEMRPFAVEIYRGEVYLGVICDGSTSSDRANLTATVYRGDGTAFTPVIDFPLNYPKGFTISSCAAESVWLGWRDAFPDAPCSIGGNTNNLFFYSYAQPMLSNIDFDADGAMVLSFTDRFSHQMGYNNADLVDPPEGGNFIAAVSGDLLRAARLPNGTYELENNATAGTLTALPGVGNGEGPGGGEFYFGDFAPNPNNPNVIAHSETGQGATAINFVTGVMTSTMIRPGNNQERASSGTTNLVAMDGTVLSGYSLFQGFNTDGVYGKGGGLGDLMLACDPLPIQIGNYVWIDEDEDGVQDACEEPVTGLPVSLYIADAGGNPVLVATTMTDADGEYYFSGDGTTGETWVNADDVVLTDTTYLIVFGDTPESDTSFVYNNTEFGVTTENTGEGNNPDLNDSDATFQTSPLGDLPAISYSTADTTDHTLDVGLVPLAVFDLALVKTLDLSTNPGPFSPGSTVDFNITVFNQGDTDATDIEVKDYVPEGLSLAPASAPNWTVSVDTAILTMPFALAAGEDSVLRISFVIDADFMLDTLVNRAEISNFDDDNDPTTDPPVDEDSTPNDNGMDAPEADTPDEIDDDGDGTPGTMDDPNDEDDYDWEGIPVVQTFDLSLVKQIDETATPGPFTYGSTVTFSIEVTNEGSLDATDVEVADYIPEGLSLLPSSVWTMDVDTARLTMPFDLAAGDTEVLSISFTIDLDFLGTSIDNLAEISAAMNALGLRDDDSRPGDNGGDDPGVISDDFSFARLSIETVSLGSTVFLDNNNDGLQNGADTGIAMIEVQLWDAATMMQVFTDASGTRVLTAGEAAPTLTDADGNYLFDNLLPGDYYVVVPTAPTAAPLSSNNTGIAFTETDPDDNLDNDDEGVQAGGSGAGTRSGTVTLALGDEPVNGAGAGAETDQGNMQDDAFDSNGNMTLDFGFFAPVIVGDTAFVDLDGDGLQTPGEPGIGGVTVALLDIDGDTVMVDADGMMITGVTTTAADGSYLFDNLPPGVYSVSFDISTADNAEFYAFTMPNAGDDADDSDNSISLSDSTAQSDPTAFLNSGEEDLTLDVGVVCAIEVEVAAPFTICSTQPIDLTQDASITPTSLGGTWSTPDGTGEFTTGMDLATATTYIPSSADALRGSVTLILTTNDPDGPCEPVSNSVLVEILKVDCGNFFWDGQD